MKVAGVARGRARLLLISSWGRKVSTGSFEARFASRGAAGLVKSGKTINANSNYSYALAA